MSWFEISLKYIDKTYAQFKVCNYLPHRYVCTYMFFFYPSYLLISILPWWPGLLRHRCWFFSWTVRLYYPDIDIPRWVYNPVICPWQFGQIGCHGRPAAKNGIIINNELILVPTCLLCLKWIVEREEKWNFDRWPFVCTLRQSQKFHEFSRRFASCATTKNKRDYHSYDHQDLAAFFSLGEIQLRIVF